MTQVDISWDKSVWFFDIDDTLIDTAGVSGSASEGIERVFADRFDSEKAVSIRKTFDELFQLMMAGYRAKSEADWKDISGGRQAFEQLLHEVEGCQQLVVEKYGAYKKWSREVFAKLAAERVGLGDHVTPELVHEAADAYWIMLTEQTTVFPHALALFQEIRRHGRPIYLITSSDARLRLRDDGQFEYDPPYSEGLKRQRIELLREKGLEFSLVTIGDPEDKPHEDFFQKGIKAAETDLGGKIDLAQAVMVGDSFGGDLQTPKEKLHFGLVVLFQKDAKNIEVVDSHQITTNNLQAMSKFLK